MWTLTIFAGPWHRYVGHVGWTGFVANLHSVLDGSADIEARKRSYVETRECFSRNWFFNCQLAVSILNMECRLRWVFFHFFWPSEIHREFVAIEHLATYNRKSHEFEWNVHCSFVLSSLDRVYTRFHYTQFISVYKLHIVLLSVLCHPQTSYSCIIGLGHDEVIKSVNHRNCYNAA